MVIVVIVIVIVIVIVVIVIVIVIIIIISSSSSSSKSRGESKLPTINSLDFEQIDETIACPPKPRVAQYLLQPVATGRGRVSL
jgi:flagellar basal body-associated protein FliL